MSQQPKTHCELCKCWLQTRSFSQHKKSLKHRRNLRQAQREEDALEQSSIYDPFHKKLSRRYYSLFALELVEFNKTTKQVLIRDGSKIIAESIVQLIYSYYQPLIYGGGFAKVSILSQKILVPAKQFLYEFRLYYADPSRFYENVLVRECIFCGEILRMPCSVMGITCSCDRYQAWYHDQIAGVHPDDSATHSHSVTQYF